MILYFADRKMNIIGQASTELPKGLVVCEDLKTEDVETGISSFECKIPFDKDTRGEVERCTAVGNYILRSYDSENEFYTIIDAEINTKNQEVYIYAEDAGLDLLNEVVGEYEADKAYSIDYYINKFAYDSGFVIGVNEAKNLTRKLSWDGEATATERIASVATQFGDYEVSYSFKIDGLLVIKKYINIYKKRGKDIGVQLRLNKEIDNIVTSKSIANLATALQCEGGTPDNAENPITLKGYTYDDGDFYVSGSRLYSRKALKTWSRYLWAKEPNQLSGGKGHIVKTYSYDTTSQQTLCAHAITELKTLREIEVNYEVDLSRLPDNVKIGDRVNIIDDDGELYLSTRILQLETSVSDQKHKATLGENLIKGSGISQKVADLAANFAKTSKSAARALLIANTAKTAAESAQAQADAAVADAANAQTAADAAITAANTAQESAAQAQAAAANANAAVEIVEQSVSSLETTVTNAQAAADNAQAAAETAQAKADEAATSASNALAEADNAKTAAATAQTTAETAVTNAATAQTTAETAKTEATAAKVTAEAAKLDAAQAQKDIDALGENLTTLSNTMSADYARKTDLTESTANLQSQISQNAAQIETTVSRVQTIDETANNAQEQAQAAKTTAEAAQAQANQATADATAAQTAADEAKTAAANAQTEADNAQAAAATAQSVADTAEKNLADAKADLATVSSRVDATEEEITAAQAAVETAQAAADKAKADAAAAAEKATTAQTTADTAVTNAANAQTAANDAASKAALAQKTADEAKGNAAAAQTAADEAAATAAEAQRTADTAVTNAANAQAAADTAAVTAAAAQSAADDASAAAAAAATDLETAKKNLADVTSRVGATEEEVAAAQAAVETAQAAADKAKADAAAAQATADTAKTNAATAQAAADTAKTAADNAQAAAADAQKAADDAQAAVDALAVRVTTAETKITQNAEKIELMATKTEVTETLGGYYSKTETDSAIQVKADEISLNVSKTYATKGEVNSIEIGGRNLLKGSKSLSTWAKTSDVTLEEDADGMSIAVFPDVETAKMLIIRAIPNLMYSKVRNRTVTISFWARADEIDTTSGYKGYPYVSLGIATTETGIRTLYKDFKTSILTSEWKKYFITVPITDDIFTGGSGEITDDCYLTVQILHYSSKGAQFKSFKMEYGDKATDWTPAPEEVDEKIDQNTEEIHQTIVEQNTAITTTCEEIILQALQSYTQTGDFEEFKETVESQLTLLSDEMTLKFTETTEQLASVNSDLQDKFNTISKYFTFNINGLIIGQVDNPYKVIIDNDRYSMTVNDIEVLWFDGNGKGYIPELTVTKLFNLFDYVIDVDEQGNINCEYTGG